MRTSGSTNERGELERRRVAAAAVIVGAVCNREFFLAVDRPYNEHLLAILTPWSNHSAQWLIPVWV